jgi:beta-1,4-mannosyltransferase
VTRSLRLRRSGARRRWLRAPTASRHDETSRPLRVLASPAVGGVDGNPYVDLLYAAVGRQGVQVREYDRRALLDRPDVVHVHWPEFLVRWTTPSTACLDVGKVLLLLWWARRRGAVLVWTGHDLAPHDSVRPRLFRLYSAAFVRMVDLLLSLAPSATTDLQARYPPLRRTPVAVVPHGHYRDVLGDLPGRDEARRHLGITTPGAVALLLGQVRPYKNVPELVAAAVTRPDLGLHLAVAGEVRGDPALADRVLAQARPGAVTVVLGRVAQADVVAWHAAADVVVLPYSLRSALHSGAALMSLSCSRPVVVADTGTMRELRDLVGPEWVSLCSGPPERFLEAAAALLEVPRAGPPDLAALDWPRLGALTVDAYRAAVRARRTGGQPTARQSAPAPEGA